MPTSTEGGTGALSGLGGGAGTASRAKRGEPTRGAVAGIVAAVPSSSGCHATGHFSRPYPLSLRRLDGIGDKDGRNVPQP